MPEAIFIPEGDTLRPTRAAASPWGETLQHGGPPAGLLARAIEQHNHDPEMQVTRLTIDLFRPVPMQPVTVQARTLREGKRIHVVEAGLFAGGVEVSRATGLLLRRSETALEVASGVPAAPPGPDEIEPAPMFPRDVRPPGPFREGFHTACEMRRMPRRGEGGPALGWVRLPLPLVAGEELSPLVRLAACCDFVNAIGSGGRQNGFATINTDCTIYVHRLPVGEWICLQVERAVEPYGLGVATATLFDVESAIGRAQQAVLANQMR